MCFSQAVLFYQGNWEILIQVSNKLFFTAHVLLNNHKTFYRGHVPVKFQIYALI